MSALIYHHQMLMHIFERGILNSGISLHKPDGYIIKEMEKGQLYLESWLDGLLAEGDLHDSIISELGYTST